MDPNPTVDPEEMELTYSILDFDMLMTKWESNISDSSLPPNDTPAEERGPQEPQTECYVPPGAAPLSLEQAVLPVPGFHAAQTNFPLLPLSDALLAEVAFGPQEPQTECYVPPGAAPLSPEQPVLPVPGFHAAQTNFPLLPLSDALLAEVAFGPQEPQTECYVPPGAAPLSLEQPVLPVPGFHAAQTDFPHLPLSDALAEVAFGPQEPQTECYMPPGAAQLSPEQPILPVPGFHAAQTDFPILPLCDAPAERAFGPQEPQTKYYRPLGGAPLTLQQRVLPVPRFHAAQTGLPPLHPYYAPAEERFGPQQPQTDNYWPLGAAQFNLHHPVMPAPEQAPPMYQPPTVMQPNYMYYQGAPSYYSQFNNGPVVSLPQGIGTGLTPIGSMNGNVYYGVADCSSPAVTSDVFVINSNAPQKKRCYTKLHDKSQPYVKRPPNAFMIFRMEQRPLVVAEIQNPECAAVNKVIGKRWKSMSKEEQARYYEYASTQKQIHYQRFPGWSTRDNYGKKRKRIRRKGPSTTEDYVI